MRGLFDLIAVVALGTIVTLVALPQRRVRGILQNEDRAIQTMLDIEKRLVRHQGAAGRDADKDGVGEFAPLGEVLGERAKEGRAVGGNGVWEIGGYYFQVLTPGASKLPVPAGSDRAAPEFAEVVYVIAAWPAEPGVTGMRAYLQSPWGILRHQIEGFPYGQDAPVPEWSLVRYEGARVARGLPYGGNDWKSPAQDLRK